ncbi:MAG: hypothetical protein HY746_00015 [Elusimicrobia bacterium]|nr:hypothetical protein [Elusimicrobiota bacterium]
MKRIKFEKFVKIGERRAENNVGAQFIEPAIENGFDKSNPYNLGKGATEEVSVNDKKRD